LDSSGTELATKCPNARMGYVQLCRGFWRISWADMANCSSSKTYTSEASMADWALDSTHYVGNDMDGSRLRKRSRGEIASPAGGIEIQNKCTGTYQNIGRFTDRPGLYLMDIKPNQQIINTNKLGGVITDWKPYKVSAELEFKTYVVTQCKDCPAECCTWYEILFVPWTMTVNMQIAGTTDANGTRRFAGCDPTKGGWGGVRLPRGSLCAVAWEAFGPNAVTVGATTRSNNCPLIRLPNCNNPNAWCNPHFRNMANWHEV
jgi:hypothetical protein